MESKAKVPAASRKARLASSHPTFYEMISDAILALKERTGSSQYAITKYVEAKKKQLPNNFRKLLLFHLKRLVASGKLVKVKNSFKLPAGEKPSVAPSKTNKTTIKQKPKVDAKSKAGSVGTKRKASPGNKKAAAAVAKAKGSSKAKKSGAATKAKKVTPMKNVKKPKSVKSPAKKKAKK